MSLATLPPMPPSPAVEPPLRDGDRMDYETFARRWDATPGIKKAELIDGEVFIMPPLPARDHGRPDNFLATVFGRYEAATPHTLAANNSTLRLDDRNGPQPDVMLMLLPGAGGGGGINISGIAFGPIELVAEVSVTSARYDLGRKLNLYRRRGVIEYIVCLPETQRFEWFRLQTDPLEHIVSDESGVARSLVFPGLWLNVPALLAQRRRVVNATADAGLASPEHAAFVQQLIAVAGTPEDW